MAIPISNTLNQTVHFYRHAGTVTQEDVCGICRENFDKDSSCSRYWNNKMILVHANDQTAKRYSCEIHKDCLKNWMAINPICPQCRSPARFDDSVHTLKDRAHILNQALDKVFGANVQFLFGYAMGLTLG